jgi:hypothetical protein
MGDITLRDDSFLQTQASSVYNLIAGSLTDSITSPTYQGLGLIYPNDGIVVINAAKLNEVIGLTNISGSAPDSAFNYNTGSISLEQTVNHKVLFWSINNSENFVKIRKSEYVPARHYFVRVKNRDYNYSNNPTYVYDGTDGIHAKGTIRNSDFITDPKTYITTIGLYNDSNDLVAVAKLSRPAVKSFDNELLCKVRIDM